MIFTLLLDLISNNTSKNAPHNKQLDICSTEKLQYENIVFFITIFIKSVFMLYIKPLGCIYFQLTCFAYCEEALHLRHPTDINYL